MKEIALTQGKVAQVDDADFEWLSQWKWHASKQGNDWYALRNIREDGRHYLVKMHRLITDAPVGVAVDHFDGDGLNNTRDNLRLCTQQQNCCNQRMKSTNKSGFKGAHWFKWREKWRASIVVHGKQKHLGYFDSLVKAACAYDDAAREAHGEFAKVNFPR